MMHFTNEQFYDASGKFLPEAAKDALIELMQYHHYPIFEGLRDRLYLTDYDKGRFADFGIALLSFVNNVEDRYMLMDIFLLPNQMLCEHCHVAAEGLPHKMEGWLVRHGKSYLVGEGEDNLSLFPQIRIPQVHLGGHSVTRHVTEGDEGCFVPLTVAESYHWQFAGPKGAIITEVANVHSSEGVRRSSPEML